MESTASLDQPVPVSLTDPLAGALCHELRITSVAVMAAMSSIFGRWNLKPSEATLLKYIGANPGCTQTDIARAHRNNAANLVPLIARLEREGLLERNPGEGRSIALSISAAGTATLASVNDAFLRIEDSIGSGLTAEQRSAAVVALRAICSSAVHICIEERQGR